jgi:hypothetical protein
MDPGFRRDDVSLAWDVLDLAQADVGLARDAVGLTWELRTKKKRREALSQTL